MLSDPADFIRFMLDRGVLRFGSFVLKSGRTSPYFFNTGLIDHGASMAMLGRWYARSIVARDPGFDMLFGPAYKGIPLATATAIAFAGEFDRDLPFAFNRKVAKDHGEGGQVVGAPLQGRVLIIDDVISAGTSVRESMRLIEAAGASLAGVAIAMDRQERGSGSLSAIQEVEQRWQVPVIPIIRLDDLIDWLRNSPGHADQVPAIEAYRARYGC